MTTNTVKIQKVAIDALEDLKALDIVTIDVRSLTTITDTMIICTGRSSRHVKSLAENVVVEAKRHKWSYINSEGQNEGEWIVVDLADVVVHVMQAETRKFYSLEDLWQMHANTHTRPR
jgi:ribosome-associated protein